ncbi:MAG TPA: NADH-quinone oxidoreductase subunit NuoK [Bacillota bacterium]|jgi:NADH:ubiquinone oxidoreductase subunit K
MNAVAAVGMIPLSYFLILGALLFGLGLYGALLRTNAVRVLMCIELMLNAVNINLVAFNQYLNRGYVGGQIFAIFIMTVAAAETAVGLAIVLEVVRRRNVIDLDKINLLKW